MVVGDSIWAKDQQIYNGAYTIDKLVSSNICHQAIFYKKEALLKTGGYNIEYKICADWDLNFNFFANFKIQYTSQVIAFFTSSGNSSVKVPDKFLDNDNDIVIKLTAYFSWSLFSRHFFCVEASFKKECETIFKEWTVFYWQ